MLNYDSLMGFSQVALRLSVVGGILYFGDSMRKLYEFHTGIKNLTREETDICRSLADLNDVANTVALLTVQSAAMGGLFMCSISSTQIIIPIAFLLSSLAYVATDIHMSRLKSALQPYIEYKRSDIEFDPYKMDTRSCLSKVFCGVEHSFYDFLNREVNRANRVEVAGVSIA